MALSNNSRIEGTKSVQLRKGSSASIPYLETAFTLERMNKLIFIAKSLQNDLVVKFINEFPGIEQSVDIKLTSVVETYTIDVNIRCSS